MQAVWEAQILPGRSRTGLQEQEFTAWLQRTGQMMMSTAAEAPHQHGAVESFHRVFRRALLAAWKHADPGASPGEMADYIVAQRNDTNTLPIGTTWLVNSGATCGTTQACGSGAATWTSTASDSCTYRRTAGPRSNHL